MKTLLHYETCIIYRIFEFVVSVNESDATFRDGSQKQGNMGTQEAKPNLSYLLFIPWYGRTKVGQIEDDILGVQKGACHLYKK